MKAQTNKTREQQSDAAPKIAKEPGTGGKATITDNRPTTVYQRKLRETMNASAANKATPIQRKTNNTGLPDNLKTGIENLSGYSMDDVKVHYNSNKPAQLQAHAYAQGTDIHVASGQEKHLPHEAWHVVQQKQGRVKPTMQLKGKVNINDDAGLEKEADVMGKRATSETHTKRQMHAMGGASNPRYNLKAGPSETLIQRKREDITPDMWRLLFGIERYGIHEFVGWDNISIYIRDWEPDDGTGQERSVDVDASRLGSGTNKLAIQFEGKPWLLLLSTGGQNNRTEIRNEIQELLNLKGRRIRVPEMLSVVDDPDNPDSYIFTVSYQETDFKDLSISSEVNDISKAIIREGEDTGDMWTPEEKESLKALVKTELVPRRPVPMQKLEELQAKQRTKTAWKNNDNTYRSSNEVCYGFYQQKIEGTELKKDRTSWDHFIQALLSQSNQFMSNSLQDLEVIEEEYAAQEWGDFQLFHERTTGYIYVFDPNSGVGNSFDVQSLLAEIIQAIKSYLYRGTTVYDNFS